MREFVDRVLEGNFDYEKGTLDFSCAKIEINIPVGEDCEGTFRIYSIPGTLTEGYINTTDFRMECLTPTFTGTEEEIAFCFHGGNMEEGDVVKGAFNIISNQGEYQLPFVVSIEHTVLHSSIGPIKNLFHFANLAKSNWQEAVKLFYSPEFVCVFTGNDAGIYDSYRGLSVYRGNEQNVEEFLIQINKKQAVEFLLEEQELYLEPVLGEDVYGVLEQEIEIVRNGWGYTALNVECDGDFLFTEKEYLTDDDFLGNRCRLPIFIDSSLCRNGKNIGQVVLYNSHVCLKLPVTVRLGEVVRSESTERRITVRLMELYQAFRMKKINLATWLKESGKLVERLVARNENHIAARLFQAQLLISEERFNEAKWILDHVESLLEQNEPENGSLLAYYLYLTTLINVEDKYVRRISEEVQEIYRREHTEWRVAWLLLYLSEEYSKSATGKWMFLEKQFYCGCYSPVLYIEALSLLNNNPALLRRLDRFELQVLHYGAKHQVLSSEVLEQVLYLAGRIREYSPVFYAILVQLYEKRQDTRVLQEICIQLIKGGKTEHKYFKWYEKGVVAQLRITNLYEYYMMALDLSVQQKLPKMLLMYFAYQNNLDYEHSAYLYRYILQQKEEYEEIYANYKLRMEYFVIDQLQKRHINRNLAFLYQTMLSPGMVTEETAKALSRLLFAHQIQVTDNRLHKVIVYHAGNCNPIEYSLQDGKAWVALYGNDYTILFEDRYGNRFAKSVDYTLEKLMVPGKFLRMIAPYNPNCIELDQYLCETEQREVTGENIQRALRVAASEDILPNVKRDIYLDILQYYYDEDMMDALDEYLEEIPFTDLASKERSSILKYMVLRGKYETAFSWIEYFGPYFADSKTLVRLATEIIRRNNMMENPMLTEMAMYAFRKGKYDSVVLAYLLRHFEGLTKDMRDLWKTARSMGVDCYQLSEKMLMQMLYSGAFIGEKMDVFQYYVSRGAKTEVENAFLTQCAYDYFVKEKLTENFIFHEFRDICLRGEDMEPVCKLAFLKYYAENPGEMTDAEKPIIEKFLREWLDKGVYLNFFRDLKGFHYLTQVLGDKTIVEYCARPGAKSTIHYVVVNENGEAGEYVAENLMEVYGGVCFKEFILFFGETLQYYITEDCDGEEQLTESGTIQKSDIVGEEHTNRYELINDMMISKTLQDYDTLDTLLEEYCRKEYWNQRMFHLQ